MTWAEELRETAPETGLGENPVNLDAEQRARELAKLRPLEYEQRREDEAKALNVRVSVLDQAVAAMRGEDADADDAPALVEDLDPWPNPVAGLELAEEVRRELLRFVVFPSDGDADAATLWVFGSYLMDAWRLFPKLLVSSPEKRCGKSTLLEAIEAHACRALLFSSITGPSLFRVVEAVRPTLLIDEADRFMRDNEALIGIINAGHMRRTARVLRTVEVGGKHEPRAYSTWCPQVIATIGGQADTIEDRAIRIGLRRRLQTETVDELPVEYFERRISARRRILKWAGDNRSRIADLDVQPPACGNDRARNNWAPLFRIAAVLGGPWPERVEAAYLLKEADDDDRDEPAGVMVLRDVMRFFEQEERHRLQSADLVAWLVEMEDRPWGEWKRGRPMTANSLSRLLRPFGIRPRKIRFPGGALMGYERAPVAAAFARYCQQPPAETGTPEQARKSNGLGGGRSGTEDASVPVRNGHKLLECRDCSDVPTLRGCNRDVWTDFQ